MKKFYSFLFLAVVGLLSFTAAAQTVNINVKIANPEAVKFYYYETDENWNSVEKVVDLKAGDNAISVKNYTYLNIEANKGFILQKVYLNDISQYVSGGASCNMSINTSNEGQTLKIEAADESTVRTAKLTVTVDDPSIVSFGFAGSYRSLILSEGTQTIAFDPTIETAIQVSHKADGKQLYQLSLNDELQTASGGTYYFEIKDGDKVDIKAQFPDIKIPVKFDLTETAQGVIKSVLVDGVAVDGYLASDFEVQIGSKLEINLDTDNFNLKSVTINGSSIYASYYINTTVYEATTIAIDAAPYGTAKVTVDINKPEAITMYRGYAYQNDIVTLNPGVNVVELSEANPTIAIKKDANYYYTTCTLNGDPRTDSGYGLTLSQLAEGDKIVLQLEEIVLDKTFVLYIDNKEACRKFTVTSSDRKSFDVSTGYNVIDFSAAFNPFNINWYGDAVSFNLFKNGEALEPTYSGGTYTQVAVEDGDVIKAYTTAAPATYTATFEVLNGEAEKVTVTKDIFTEVSAWQGGISDLQGTLIEIEGAEKVTVNDIELTADEDGSFSFNLDADSKVVIDGTTGVSTIGANSAKANNNVYNAQGVLLIENATPEQVNALDKGFYIVGGKKTIVNK